MPVQRPPEAPAPEMSAAETALWRDYVARRCGLWFTEGRVRVLRQALWSRATACRLGSYADYYHHVLHHPRGAEEWPRLLDLLLNKQTSFFRHQGSFEVLTTSVFPTLPVNRPARLWSAACSTGQEAYSLAIAAREALGPDRPFEVVATDLSRACLDRVRLGRYRTHELRGLPDRFREAYFASGRDTSGAYHEVAPELRAAVRPAPFNLADPATYPAAEFDVIFCQNVLIYFPPESRPSVARHLAERLRPGGHLFLGPAEAIGLKAPGLDWVRCPEAVAYRRPGVPNSVE